MAVDMFIHIVPPEMGDDALQCIFHNHYGHKLENFEYKCPQNPDNTYCFHKQMLTDIPGIEIGSKHWGYYWWNGTAPDDLDDPVSVVAEVFDDFDEITPAIIEKINDAYDLPSTKMFHMDGLEEYRVRVIDFLNQNVGNRAFIMGW